MNAPTPEGAKYPALADIKLLNTPSAKSTSKGKHREEETWQLGWWDFAPIMEGKKPPIQWTNSSTILSAHATEPLVVCLHYPSNKHSTLPSPPPLGTSSASYAPPAIISASSRDNWVFAYFPGVDVEGVGCLWRRLPTIDAWVVKDWWKVARGDGIVAARWLNLEREWVTTESGSPARLPLLGPPIPHSQPILFIVTERHLCNIYYAHPQTETVKMLGASLCRRSISKDGEPRATGEPIEGPRGVGRCSHAAIGFTYEEPSIVIATRSSYVPSSAPDSSGDNAVDLTMSLTGPSPRAEPPVFSEYETWRDENVIRLCEVNLAIQGILLAMSTLPLPPIRLHSGASACVTDILFVPALPTDHQGLSIPTTPIHAQRLTTPVASPAMGHAQVPHSPGRPGQRPPIKPPVARPGLGKMKGTSKPTSALYLLCTLMDVGQYASAPRSDVTLFTVMRDPAFADASKQPWAHKRLQTLSLPASVVVHISPCQTTASAQQVGALVAVINTDGPITRRRGQKLAPLGKFQMLRLPDLQFDDGWESTGIICPVNASGIDPPFNMAVSPNRALICSASSLSPLGSAASLHPHPNRVSFGMDFNKASKPQRRWANSIILAVQRRCMPNDVVHFLASPSAPVLLVEEVLEIAFQDVESSANGLHDIMTNNVIGVACDIYRLRSLSAKSDGEKADMQDRHSVAHDICTLIAISKAWEDSVDGEGFDLDAVWYLVGLSSWTVEFTEKLMKECVLFANDIQVAEAQGELSTSTSHPLLSPAVLTGSGDDLFGQSEAASARAGDGHCCLLHLVHPFALENLLAVLQSVKRFREYLGSLTAKGESAQVAKEVLVDLVDSSGIDFDILNKTLTDLKSEVKRNADRAPEAARRCLASLRPPPLYKPMLQTIVSTILQANIINKTRLFVKPDDLVDGILGLSVTSQNKKHERDVIDQGFLPGRRPPLVCVRCRRKTEIGSGTNIPGQMSIRWLAWERSYLFHCVCGGLWANKL